MQDTKPMVLSVGFGEKGTVYGCGHALDTFCYALKLTTEDELMDMNIDSEADHERYAFDNFNFADALRDELNELTATEACDRLGVPDQSDLVIASDYLPGDYFRLEQPAFFAEQVEAYKEKALDALADRDETRMPAALWSAIEGVREDFYDELTREWLNGDYRGEFPGVLYEIPKKLFDSDVDCEWDQKADEVVFTLNDPDEAVRNLYGYDLGDGDALPSVGDVTAYLKAYILDRAHDHREADKRRREARQEERAKTEAYKAERAKQEREEAEKAARERKARMVREAKERKEKKKTTQ